MENRDIQNLDIFVSISNGFDKWLGFRISDSIQNPDYLQTNLFLTIRNPPFITFLEFFELIKTFL